MEIGSSFPPLYLPARWRVQSPEDHAAHEKHVAFRGMLEAVYEGT